MKKLTTILLVACLLLGVLSSCNNDVEPSPSVTAAPTPSASSQPVPEDDKPLYMADELTTYEVWCSTSGNTLITSLNDSMFPKNFSEATNVMLTYKHPSSAGDTEGFNLMIASGDLTDVIGNAGLFQGGGDKAVEDEYYLQLNDFIDQYMPNYASFRARGGEFQKNTISDNGIIWALYSMSETPEQAWAGLSVRGDWLKDLGLAVPETISEWDTVLTAFKEQKGATRALSFPKSGRFSYGDFMSAWDIGYSGNSIPFYQEGGAVKFAPIEKEYYNYLELTADWFSRGLIDPDFLTGFSSFTEIFVPWSEKKTGAGNMVWGWVANEFITRGLTDEENFYINCVPAPVLEKGNTQHFGMTVSAVLTPWAISATCENPDTLIKALDYLYTNDGMLMLNYGVEGLTYDMVDGKPKVSQKIFDEAKEVEGSGDPWTHTLSKYTWHNGLGIYDHTKLLQSYKDLSAHDEASAWEKAARDYVLPGALSMTDAEGSEYSAIMGDITTLVEETTVKIITGALPLSEYENMVTRIKSMNIDRAIEIYQAAFDRYNNR